MKITTRSMASVFALALGFAFVLLSGVHAYAGDPAQGASKYQINIQDFSFQPVSLNVPLGATVTWTNKDEEPHTVYSTDDVFKSKALDSDEAFSFTFKKAGTYKYFCSVHPKMVGTIVVGSSKQNSAPLKADEMRMDGPAMGPLN